MEKEKKLLLAPSMGCCDLYDFEHQVRFIDEHADFLHIDIKDGNYVKTFGVGPDFMTVLKKVVKKPEASTGLHRGMCRGWCCIHYTPYRLH